MPGRTGQSGAPGRIARHRVAEAAARAVGGDHALGQRGRAADVEDGQREWHGQVIRERDRDRPGEQDGVPRARDLLRLAVPAGEPVGDRERGEAQRDQRGDAQAGAQAERGLRARLGDDAGKHAARAGHRVVHLAAPADGAEHGCAHRVRGPAGGLADLAERRGVEVKPLDVDADLVGLDPRIGVEPPRGLGQDGAAAPGITGPRPARSPGPGSQTRCSPSGELVMPSSFPAPWVIHA